MSSSGYQNPSSVALSTSRPSELFRADLISAMKVPDTHPLEPNSYIEIKEAWRTEWEAGVQVCASELPRIRFKHGVRSVGEASNSYTNNSSDVPTVKPEDRHHEFKMPPDYMTDDNETTTTKNNNNGSTAAAYDVDELDIAWLESVNSSRKYKVLSGVNILSEDLLQKAMTILEIKCHENMLKTLKNKEALQIECDESVVCDICRDPESEENNEMVFCDSCNICVHQACYGVLVIPEGSWVCKPCGSHIYRPACALCPNKSGAMKKIKPGPGWAHISCSLWIPEVKFGNVDRMEPVTNIEGVSSDRWSLTCSICRKKEGACIQCSYPTCFTAYHVTCGFREGLEMRTRLVSTGVVNESYCVKHTKLRKTPTKNSSSIESEQMSSKYSSQLKILIDSFHDYAITDHLVEGMGIPLQLASLIRNYWILKRKSRHNHPLISDLVIDFRSQRLPSGLEYHKAVPEDEDFLNIIHLRQNLEMARNLVYMVRRREKFKKQMICLKEEITKLELNQLDEEEKRANKQPLCLKRLKISEDTSLKLNKNISENGGENISSNSDTENGRVLRRKKNIRIQSTSEDELLSPKRTRKGSEGGDGLSNITRNGRYSSTSEQ